MNEIPNGEIEQLESVADRGLPSEYQWPAAARIAVQVPSGQWLFGTFRHAWPDEDGGWFGMIEEDEHDYWLPTPQPQGIAPQGKDWQHTLVCHSERNPEGAAGAFRMVPFTQEPVRIENGKVVDMAKPAPEPEAPVVQDADQTNNVDAGPDRMRAHYRYGVRVTLTPEDIERGYVDVNLDPYRLAELYRVGGGPREQVMKKSLRGTSKGQTEQELVDDIQAAVDRWRETLLENEQISLMRPET